MTDSPKSLWELTGTRRNQTGTDGLAGRSPAPSPFREGLGTSHAPELATSNLYGMTDAELLDCLGPSWNEVAEHRRDFHPGYRSAA